MTTVKSQTSRALAKLKVDLALQPDPDLALRPGTGRDRRPDPGRAPNPNPVPSNTAAALLELDLTQGEH